MGGFWEKKVTDFLEKVGFWEKKVTDFLRNLGGFQKSMNVISSCTSQ